MEKTPINLTAPDKTLVPPPVRLKFNKLPKQIQERLSRRQDGEGKGFAFKTAEVVSSYISIIIAVLWFGLLFYLTNDFLWGKFQLVIFSLISFIASYLLLFNLYKLFRWFTSGAKCCLLITP
ncbi:MAG TPA: hypothetical protein VNB22_12250, partial [Pyrinomonadaceae bacterium]|nr:hypothetical protein [Pyrinomonadaceae bacterium]